ncbi:Cytochrome c [Caulifigura coniformis]|uniref:Cytochrome c n=1 Tax=Caulifigura coniformis TaxID=2527983 RepID=A0A517SIX5_9PLAN|nr:PVC-type heme-binding CxxCH protein [Caulifigura coniformis]QDT56088.1 Cytochrome c [Caulifigura coniformis]
MRPVAVVVACVALTLSLFALAAPPSPPKAETGKPAATPAAVPPAIVADKTRIDPVTVDPAANPEKIDRIPGLTPDQAKKTLAIQKGFDMQLAASEPNVADPVDAAFDEAGRMYVAEFKSYPYSEEIRIPQQPTAIGKHNACLVRRLEDKDGDGVFETSTVFADGLSWVMSVACYDGGVFVLAPPHLYYIKDTNGDGVADEKKIVLTGFSRYNVQAAANNLKWTLDNRICGAGGPNGGDLVWNGVPIGPLRGQDFIFDPKAILGTPPAEAKSATPEKPYRPEWFERIAGAVQFGNSFDDFGNRFVSSNSDHIRQEVFPLSAANRTAGFTPSQMIRSIATEGPAAPVFRTSPPEPWRIVRTKRRIADPKTLARLSESERSVTGGFFTSATGVTIYRGDAYPPEFSGNVFVGDVGGNLIHRKTLAPNGAALVATRADQNIEFVTSTDTWFRPVNFVNGPDGCLYVLDMYRETIEHPYSIPEDIKAHLDLESGSEWGRVWRLAPPGFKEPKIANLGKLSSAELVPFLAHKNAWHRQTASRLLTERQDKSVVAAIRTLLNETKSDVGLVHALATLNSLASLKPADVSHVLDVAFASNQPQVAAFAVQVGGIVASHPEIAEKYLALSVDADHLSSFAPFRFRLSIAIAEWPTDRFIPAFLTLSQGIDGKKELSDALMSSVVDRAGATASAVLAELSRKPEQPKTSGLAALSDQLISLAATRGSDDLTKLLNSLVENKLPADRMSKAIRASLVGLRQRGLSLVDLLAREDLGPEAKAVITGELENAARIAAESDAKPAARSQAFQLLAMGDPNSLLGVAEEALTPQTPSSLQTVIAKAVADSAGDKSAEWMVSHWSSAAPALRVEFLEGLMRSPSRTKILLAAVESGAVKAVELPADRREQLRIHPDASIRELASKLFEAASADRLKIVAEYEPALEKGDAERGLAIFKKTCAQCHKVGNDGFLVGPQLVSVKNKSPRDLLLAVLDPNREALPQFMNYTVATDDGRIFTGILVSETDSSVTLRRAEGKEDVIPREQIEILKSTGQSLMPVGLEKDLSAQDVADVIAWIKALEG